MQKRAVYIISLISLHVFLLGQLALPLIKLHHYFDGRSKTKCANESVVHIHKSELDCAFLGPDTTASFLTVPMVWAAMPGHCDSIFHGIPNRKSAQQYPDRRSLRGPPSPVIS